MLSRNGKNSFQTYTFENSNSDFSSLIKTKIQKGLGSILLEDQEESIKNLSDK